MNYYIFKKENDDFSEFFKDKNLKKLLRFKIRFSQHLIIASYDDVDDKLQSYITLKYGDYMANKHEVFGDFSPKINVDYIPSRDRPNKFKDL